MDWAREYGTVSVPPSFWMQRELILRSVGGGGRKGMSLVVDYPRVFESSRLEQVSCLSIFLYSVGGKEKGMIVPGHSIYHKDDHSLKL